MVAAVVSLEADDLGPTGVEGIELKHQSEAVFLGIDEVGPQQQSPSGMGVGSPPPGPALKSGCERVNGNELRPTQLIREHSVKLVFVQERLPTQQPG